MKKQALLIIMGIAILIGGYALGSFLPFNAQIGSSSLKTDIDTFAFGVGIDMGYSIKDFAVQNEIGEEFSEENFIKGIKAGLANNEDIMSKMDAQMHVQQFIMAQQQAMQMKGQEDAVKTLDEGLAFLEENKNRDEVIVTASGLQYEIITKGTGATPSATDNVEVHYHGTLIDGTVFDSSVDRDEAATFQVGGVIAGWTEALQLMKEGSKWKLYIPSELAYGDRQRSEVIKANSTLIFEVELIDVKEN